MKFLNNLKVRTKLLLGFGTIVLLIVINAVVIVSTANRSTHNVENIDLDVKLQSIIGMVRQEFSNAQSNAEVLYNMISEESFKEFSAETDTVDGLLLETNQFVSNNEILHKFISQIEDFTKIYDAWDAKVTEVNDIDRKMTALNEEIKSTMQVLLEITENSVVTRIDMNAPYSTIKNAYILVTQIRNARFATNTMMESLNDGEKESIINSLNDVMTVLNASLAVATGDTKTSLQTIYDGADLWIKDINLLANEMDNSKKVSSEAEAYGTQAIDSLNLLLQNVDSALSDRTSDTLKSTNSLLIIAVVIASFSVMLAIVTAVAITNSLSAPIVGLATALNYLATTGNLQLPDDLNELAGKLVGRKDEMGLAATSYGNLMERFGYLCSELEKIANGDLTSEIKLASSNDAMGNALKQVVDNLNDMFMEIEVSSEQVSVGSRQIADGSQALAQSSNQQASVVEELLSTVSLVASSTSGNAKQASEAASLGNTIKNNAEKGTMQMDSMMNAVKEINEASLSINKVIKVIDDIAFQTNILALNAAVEAARAGQHGKGFAVVAEEVRNLAAKSAEAAKDTSGLIENSIDKAKLGAQIAEETAASLSEIVEGINNSSVLINNIAQTSSEQTTAIDQINIGISQVANAVQQNNGTAQESAAASEEMSSQAVVLEELVYRFKLKDMNKNNLKHAKVSQNKNEKPKKQKTLSLGVDEGFGKY